MIDKIFLVHHAHTDTGFTDFVDTVRTQHSEKLDRIIELCTQNRNRPEGEQFKWTIESAWVVHEYMRTRSEEQNAKLIALLQEGLIELTGFFTQILTELPTFQELAHSVEFAARLGQRYDFDVSSGMLCDLGGATWMLPEVLSQSGIRYYTAGCGGWRVLLPWVNLPPLFRWQSPSGNSVLFWQYGSGMGDQSQGVGALYPQYAFGYYNVLWPLRGWYDPVARKYLYDVELDKQLGTVRSKTEAVQSARDGMDALQDYLAARDYPYDAVMFQAGADNFGPDPLLCETIDEWNKTIESPRVIIATQSEFFRYMEGRYAADIPVLNGEFSCPWSDHAGTAARETALYREGGRRWRKAGIVAGLGRIAATGKDSIPADNADEICWNLLHYSDHTFGLSGQHLQETVDAAGPVTDPVFDRLKKSWRDKAQYAESSASLAQQDLDKALTRLGDELPGLNVPNVVVVNADLSTRSDLVRVNLPADSSHLRPYDVVKQEFAPADVLVENDSATSLTFLAADVPGGGYKVYPLKKTAAPTTDVNTSSDTWAIENRFYRIAVDEKTGCIGSIYDKELDAELVDAAARWPFNEYIHEELHDLSTDATAAGMVVPQQRTYRVPEKRGVTAERHVAELSQCLSINRAVVDGPSPVTLTQTVRLWSHTKRIDIVNRIVKEPTLKKEAVYFAFPFAVEPFSVQCEIAGTILELGKDQLPGSHTDYQAIQNTVALSGGDTSVLWCTHDAPLVSFGDARTFMWAGLDYHPDQPHLYSYIMNNCWPTNCRFWQEGETVFRYSLTSRRKAPTRKEIVSFGRLCAEPLEAYLRSPGGDLADTPPTSLFKINGDGLLLEAIEHLADVRRIRALLIETNGVGSRQEVVFNADIVAGAWRTDLLGNVRDACTIHENSRVEFATEPYELVVVEFELDK